jgi:outer membrane protein assembly factor BamB/predicted Fe-S protein YdhL (DUF1289 family)
MEEAVRESSSPGDNALTCPWCGATDQASGNSCQGCGRFLTRVPEWAETTPSSQRRLITRKRVLMAVLAMVIVGFVVWLNFPFLPDPVIILFKRPTTKLTSDLFPQQWAMAGWDLKQSRHLPDLLRQPEGRVVWSTDLGGPTRSPPIVVDKVIYVGGQFKIIALDATNGQVLWEQRTVSPIHSSLAIAGETLYYGLLDHRLIARDLRTGETSWQFKTGNILNAAPVIANGMVYVASDDTTLYALDAATGQLIWEYEALHPLSQRPSIQDGVLFINDDVGNLYILNARTGQERLRFRTRGTVNASPVPADDLVYFSSGGQVYAVNSRAKEVPGQFQFKKVWAQFWLWQVPGVPRPRGQQGGVWRFSPAKSKPSINSAPAAAQEALYVGDLRGKFFALDPASGMKLWEFQTEAGINSSPLVLGDQVYFGALDGTLYALERNAGELTWQLDLGAGIEVPPVYNGTRLYVKTKDGLLHALE